MKVRFFTLLEGNCVLGGILSRPTVDVHCVLDGILSTVEVDCVLGSVLSVQLVVVVNCILDSR